jgi:hypothetical protein
MLSEAPEHPLNQRFELARKLATAVLFLYVVGWVHKAIRSANVVVLQSNQMLKKHRYPKSLGDPYLIEIESSRSVEQYSNSEERVRKAIFDQDIYDHLYRVSEDKAVDQSYTIVHDIYSLGVVLLEVSF